MAALYTAAAGYDQRVVVMKKMHRSLVAFCVCVREK